MIPWVTVETLSPKAMSVATVGDSPRDFVSLQRVIQRLLARQPGIRDAITTQGLIDVLETTRRQRHEFVHEIASRVHRYRVVSRPVLGPDGDVHAVRFWLGPIGPMPVQRPALGLIWDRTTQTIRHSHTASADCSHAATLPSSLSIAELFHVARDFDRHEEVLDTLYNPKPGGRLQFDLTTAHNSGRTTQWRNTIRIAVDDPARLARWLAEDVSSADAPPAGNALELRGLKEAVRRSAMYVAVVELAYTSISHWLTDPAPWIKWARLSKPTDAFHPDDRHQLAHAADRIWIGDSTKVTLRTLNHRGGYTLTNVLLYPFPGHSSRHVAICELTLAAPEPAHTPT
jgi:Domain of unknown function (DUF5593)